MKKRSWILCLIFLLALSAGLLPAVSENDAGTVRLVCLNIGKADCMLLLYRDHAFLIDTGYGQNYPALEMMLRQYGIEHLDGVFLTHCHEDHQGGLAPLAQSGLPVDAWYASRFYRKSEEGRHPAVQAAASRNQDVSWLAAGDTIAVGKDASFAVLGPMNLDESNENNNSLVMRFSSPQGSILFAGDMKEDEENELLEADAFTPCDVLKVAHHGDNKATTKEMLQIVRPQAAVILTSTQEEPDTPASSTLKRLKKVNCEVYVSQDWHDALQLTLKNGKVSAEDIQWDNVPSRAENIALSIDVYQDILTIYNQGSEEISLRGCCVYSTKGNELVELPDAQVLPGGQFVIGSRLTAVPVDENTMSNRIWNKSSLDMAILYDAYGRPLACTDNGLGE